MLRLEVTILTIYLICMISGLGTWRYHRDTGHGYFFSSGPATWDNARAQCELKGGYLTTVNNAQENTFIYNQISGAGSTFFIGLYRDGNDEDPRKEIWKWIQNNEVATYQTWATFHPWLGVDYTRVTILPENGKWWDISYWSQRRYICEVDDACYNPNIPCSNGDLCVTTNGNTNACSCGSDFNGPMCNIQTNTCVPNPCQGGICQNAPTGYVCDCSNTGYSGQNCDVDINECLSYPCSPGYCQNFIGYFRCDCYGTGFTGPRCEANINECIMTTNPCNNGGTCIDGINEFVCQCNEYYTGDRCEIDVNECEIDGLCNNGTCHNLDGGFDCLCNAGFSGHRCTTDINECILSPGICQNDGKCENTRDSYDCNCTSGWHGQNCTIPTLEACDSSPCQNDGICQNNFPGYVCKCKPNFVGTNCEGDVDECIVTPSICRNNGNCTNVYGGYNCTCGHKYHGSHCEFDSSERRNGSAPISIKNDDLRDTLYITFYVGLVTMIITMCIALALIVEDRVYHYKQKKIRRMGRKGNIRDTDVIEYEEIEL